MLQTRLWKVNEWLTLFTTVLGFNSAAVCFILITLRFVYNYAHFRQMTFAKRNPVVHMVLILLRIAYCLPHTQNYLRHFETWKKKTYQVSNLITHRYNDNFRIKQLAIFDLTLIKSEIVEGCVADYCLSNLLLIYCAAVSKKNFFC